MNEELAKGKEIELKRAGEALRESEARSRLILRTIPSGLFTVDLDRRITSWSKGTEEITGLKAEQVIGKTCLEALDCDECKKGCALFDDKVDKPIYGKECAIHVDGRDIIVSKNADILKDSEGDTIGGLESFVDITKRKQAEEELIRLSNAVKMSTDSIVISDLEGKIIDVNEATLEMYGADDKKDLIGKNSFDLIAPEDREKAFAGMKEAIKKGYIKGREYQIIIKDGSKIPVGMNVAIMKDADGKPLGFVAITRNITERKRAEEALQESENKYRTVFENTGTATVIIEEDTTISLANGEAVELSGYSKEELEGKSWTELVAKEDLQRMIEYHKMRRSDPDSAPKDYECRFIDKMGNVKTMLMTIDTIPGTKKSVASVLDITDRKKMEEERLKAVADKQRIEELEKFAKIAVGRELKMVELKERIKELESKLEEITRKE